MKSGLKRPCKPETDVANTMREAISRLRLSAIKINEIYTWQLSLPDEEILVELWGGSRFSNGGEVILHSTRRGQWFANLNGSAQTRVGKPFQKWDGEKIKQYLLEQGKMPRCHQ